MIACTHKALRENTWILPEIFCYGKFGTVALLALSMQYSVVKIKQFFDFSLAYGFLLNSWIRNETNQTNVYSLKNNFFLYVGLHFSLCISIQILVQLIYRIHTNGNLKWPVCWNMNVSCMAFAIHYKTISGWWRCISFSAYWRMMAAILVTYI